MRRRAYSASKRSPGSEGDLPAGARSEAARATRQRYLDDLGSIGNRNKQWLREGRPAEWRAREASKLRKEARLRARSEMDPEGIKWAEARDMKKYGHPDGPTFEQKVAEARAKGLTGDAVYEDVIDAAQRSDPGINRGVLGGD